MIINWKPTAQDLEYMQRGMTASIKIDGPGALNENLAVSINVKPPMAFSSEHAYLISLAKRWKDLSDKDARFYISPTQEMPEEVNLFFKELTRQITEYYR